LLPAFLGFIGLNIDKWSIHRRSHHGTAAMRESMWHRWSRVVQAHPWPPFVAALGVLILLAIPVFSLRMGSTDAGNDPKGTTTRQAYDLLSAGFGPGFNGPFQLAADLSGAQGGAGQGMATLNKLVGELRTTPDVAEVSPPVPNQAGDAAVIFLTP